MYRGSEPDSTKGFNKSVPRFPSKTATPPLHLWRVCPVPSVRPWGGFRPRPCRQRHHKGPKAPCPRFRHPSWPARCVACEGARAHVETMKRSMVETAAGFPVKVHERWVLKSAILTKHSAEVWNEVCSTVKMSRCAIMSCYRCFGHMPTCLLLSSEHSLTFSDFPSQAWNK